MAVKRQQIVDKIVTRLQRISVANGYYSALGANVYAYRSTTLQQSELPACVLRDPHNEKIQEWAGNPPRIDWNLHCEVELKFAAGGVSDTKAREGIADVMKTIGLNDSAAYDDTLDGLAIGIHLDNDVINEEQKEKVINSAKVKFMVMYRTTKFQES